MDVQQQRIAEDLAGSFSGDLLFDPLSCQQYATDGSLYQIRPLGVARPRTRDDVVVLARYSHEMRIPLIARGAGTGLAGGCLGRGLIVDFSRHLREIESVDGNTVRVQPGVVREALNRRLREYDRYLPPDPSNSSVTTIGGMLAVDAAGSHAIRVGSMRDHVRSIEMVLPEGALIEAGLEPIPREPPALVGSDDAPIESPSSFRRADPKRAIVEQLTRLLRDKQDLIRRHQPPLVRNVAGYHLRTVLGRTELNLPRLLVGSEGTLGLFTAATLHTSPLPAHRGAALVLFGQLEPAVRCVPLIADQQPSACDLMDRRLLSLARETTPRFESLIPNAAEAALLIEQTGFTREQVESRLKMAIAAVRSIDPGAIVALQTFDFDELEFLWSLAYRVVPLLTRLKGATRPLPIIEDISIPPECLNEFLLEAQRVFQRHQVTASLYAHAASGQIHLRPFLPPPSPANGPLIETLAHDLYDATFLYGGSVSGEHGDGLARTAFLKQQYGPLYHVLAQVKQIFDPRNLLNPGKIINDDPHLTVRNFRPAVLPAEVSPLVELQLNWSREELTTAAMNCNGCGQCRTTESALRMCPFFRLEPSEEASPRSKANVVRAAIDGEINPRDLTTEPLKRLADLCFNCKQCQLECPANVDIPHLMIEARATYVAANGLSRADWILSRAHSFGRLGSTVAPFANWALGNPAMRWLLDRFLGIAKQRKLPPFARRTFLRQTRRSHGDRKLLAPGSRPVVYFVDHFVNYHDPQLGWAFLKILEHHDVRVFVPPEQTGSGMAMISAADLDAARELAEYNVRTLAEFAREGCTIVCTEPAAALCLSQEYPRLLKHPDVPVVAERVMGAGAFLKQLQSVGRLKTDLRSIGRMRVAYHTPCHLKAINRDPPLVEFLRRIPDLEVVPIDEGCSGMAGAFGLTREHFETSMAIGRGLVERMRSPDLMAGSTECSSCRIQMEQGAVIPTLHPLKLLALSYGLLPELRGSLKPGTHSLLTTC